MPKVYELEIVVFGYQGHFDVTWPIPCYVLLGRLGFSRGVLFRLTDKTLKVDQQEGRDEDIITSAIKKQSLDIVL
jgi:hypothetical protein